MRGAVGEGTERPGETPDSGKRAGGGVPFREAGPAVERMLVVAGAVGAVCALYLLCSGAAFAAGAGTFLRNAQTAAFLTFLAAFAAAFARAARPLAAAGGRAYRVAAALVGAGFALGLAQGALGGAAAPLDFAALPFLAFSCMALAVFWAACLSSYAVQTLRMTVCGGVAAVGVVGLVMRDAGAAHVAAACCGLFSLACALGVWKWFRGREVEGLLAARAEVQIKARSFIIDFLTGLGLGAAAGVGSCLSRQGVPPDDLLFWASSAVVAAAAASAVCMSVFRERYFWATKYLHAFLLTPALLAFALLPREVFPAAFGCAVFAAMLFFCIHAVATVEFLRYYDDHPLRIVCGGALAAGSGMLVAFCLFALAQLAPSAGLAPSAPAQGVPVDDLVPLACAAVVMLLLGMHLGVVFFCSYPFDGQFNLDLQVASRTDGEGKGRLRRHAQIETVAQRFGLTAREREILELMARGRNAKYISDKLTISPSTTKTHVYHLYAKLGVHTQQELIDLVEGATIPGA